tara:strand:+ start:1162 stop:2169 length:1008 start_codon:yes stop_codon:yes gene_type:complete
MSSKIKVDTIEDVGGSSNITIGTNLTMDVAGDITLDAGGADVKLSDDGTNFLNFQKTSSTDVQIGTPISDGDLSIVGTDGGSAVTAMKFDMSAGGVVTVDPSNNLSTASGANAKLNVGTLSGTAAALNVNVAGTDGAGAYRLINATDGQTTNFLVKTDNSGSENRLELGPETSSAIAFEIAGSEKMKISASGAVTMPSQPMFHISGTSAVSVSTHGTGSLTYTSANSYNSTTEYDPGGHFDHSTGRFTAPVAGRYFFIFSIGVAYTSNYHYNYIRKNNADVSGFSRNSAQNSDYLTNVIQGILNLAQGDYVTAARNTNYNAGAINAPMFCGFLIG